MEISEKIKFFRNARGFTQLELSELTGISLTSIKQYELGKVKPKQPQMAKIAKALMLSETIFYDYCIETVGDVIALLFAIDDTIDIEFEGKQINNEFTPDTVSLKFKSKYLKDFMAKWATMKSHLKLMEDEISNIKSESVQSIVKTEIDNKYTEYKNLYNTNINNDIIIKKGTEGIKVRLYNTSKKS